MVTTVMIATIISLHTLFCVVLKIARQVRDETVIKACEAIPPHCQQTLIELAAFAASVYSQSKSSPLLACLDMDVQQKRLCDISSVAQWLGMLTLLFKADNDWRKVLISVQFPVGEGADENVLNKRKRSVLN